MARKKIKFRPEFFSGYTHCFCTVLRKETNRQGYITKLLHLYYVFLCNRTRLFVRWMHGTCIETPPQHAEGEDEPVVFSFFTDISSNQAIIDLVTTISKGVQSSLGMLNKYLIRYRKYRRLWKLDKVGTAS